MSKPIKKTATQVRQDSDRRNLARRVNYQAKRLHELNLDRIKHYDHVSRADGWVNVLTGQGMQGYDKRTGGYATYGITMYEMDAEYLYASDAFAARIVDIIPHECLREWIEWDKDNREMDNEHDRLQVKAKCEEAWQFARAYGGSCLFINDGTPPEQLWRPLNLNNLQQIKSFTPYSRWELYIMFEDLCRDITDPMFMKPLYYRLLPRIVLPSDAKGGSPVYVRIHHSRMIRFDGKKLLRLLTIRNQYWSDSIFTSVLNELRDFGISFGAVGNLVQDFRLVVHKIKDLALLLTTPGGSEDLKQRINAMGMARSILGTYALDKDEDIQMLSAGVEGLPQLLDKIMRRLASATDIPHTRLFNESPSGLAATGNTEQRDWYDHVRAIQTMYFAPKLDRINEVIYAQKKGPFAGKQPEQNKYSFKRLWQPTESEQADIDLKNMQTYSGYIDRGVLEPEQVIEREFPEEIGEELDNELRKRNFTSPDQSTKDLGEKINEGQGANP